MDPILTLFVGVLVGAALMALGIQMGWRVANYQSPIPPILPAKMPEPIQEEPEEKQVLPFAADPNNL